MFNFQKTITAALALATALIASTGAFAHNEPKSPDYIQGIRAEIGNGKCYALSMSGSKISGRAPASSQSFSGSGKLQVGNPQSLNTRMVVNSNAQAQTVETIWFSSRNELPVGGVISESGGGKIDFERLRLKRFSNGFLLTAESHTGDQDSRAYSIVIHEASGC